MEFKNFSFLIIALITVAFPVIWNFRNPARLQIQLKYFFPAVIFTGIIFIIWNMRFEELGIWSFNPAFLTGKSIFRVPVEEWIFLIGISYFSFLMYETVKLKIHRFGNPNIYVALSLILLVVFGLTAYFSRVKLYTFFTFFLLTVYLAYTIFRNRFKNHFPHFYLAYFLSFIPFVIIKSVLIRLPALTYDNMHILGIRLLQVPVEDFASLFLLVLMNVTIFEYLNERRFY